MQFHKITDADKSSWDPPQLNRFTMEILREIRLEKGRVQAHRDTIDALKQRMAIK